MLIDPVPETGAAFPVNTRLRMAICERCGEERITACVRLERRVQASALRSAARAARLAGVGGESEAAAREVVAGYLAGAPVIHGAVCVECVYDLIYSGIPCLSVVSTSGTWGAICVSACLVCGADRTRDSVEDVLCTACRLDGSADA